MRESNPSQTSNDGAPEPPLTEPLAAAPPASLLRPGRRKLWDIPHKFHCPVIGTCLSVAELRQIALRFVPCGTAPLSDYEIHVSFVGAASARNGLSIAAHKALERKYPSTVKRFARARDADALRDLWLESLARGEVPGAFWALMTHGKADHDLLAAVREGEVARLAERERDLSGRIASLDDGAAARQIAELEVLLASLKTRLADAEREVASQRCHQAAAQRDGEEQGLVLQEKQAECEALERLLAASLAPGTADGCGTCPDLDCPRRADLAGRLVLCVGGRLPHVQEFRRLVARCNGRFDHHDGGLEDGAHRLESLLAGADAVVCATDFVSHAAYHRTKRYCKRHEKPHVLLQRSGLAAFALALERVTP